MRHIIKHAYITVTLQCSGPTIPRRTLSLLTVPQREKFGTLNPDPHACLGNGRYTSAYFNTDRYLKNCASCCVDSFSDNTLKKFFSTLNIGQTSKHTFCQLGEGYHICASRSFQASTAAKSAAEFVQNNECRHLEITLGVSTLNFPFVWLRDHCRSQKYYNHTTFQKNADPDLLKRDLTPAAVEYSENKQGIRITWQDGHVTEYTFEFLFNNFYPGFFSRQTQRLLWDKAIMESELLPAVPYDDHLTKESGLKQTLRNLVKYGFTFVTGTPASVESTQAVAERVAVIYQTIFGQMWTFTADGSRDDSAFSTQSLGAHTDNTYLSAPAGIQIFHCLEHNGSGGETLLVDGFNAIEIIRALHPSAFQLLSKAVIPHEYKESPSRNSPGYHLYTLGTVISPHPASGELLQIRYNPYDRAPLNTIAPDSIEAFYEAYDKLSYIITDPASEFWIKLQPGSVVLIDNWRVLHGRAGFDGKRLMCGCYLPRDEWTSKARLLGVL